MRRHLSFACEGESLTGTLDHADGKVGLLIVSGGNEIRSGAFGGQARMARRIAEAGYPVFRFDRRGVGDSEGRNLGYRSAGPDIAAALDEFRKSVPAVVRIVGFGNCDAATALALHCGSRCDALVLANPWTFDDDEFGAMPPLAIRKRYRQKLREPREWIRLLSGGVSIGRLSSGLRQALKRTAPPSDILSAMRDALVARKGAVSFLVAGRDRTGLAFLEAWGEDERVQLQAGADHAFSSDEDFEWLEKRLITVLDEQARQLDVG